MLASFPEDLHFLSYTASLSFSRMHPSSALPRGNACLACRRKKSKCDGTKPICHPCSRTRNICVYNEPPKSRTQQLQDKIQELQNKVAQLENARGSSTSSSRGSNSTPSPPHHSMSRDYPASPGPREAVPGAGGMVWNVHPDAPPQPFTGEITPGLRELLVQTFLANRDKCCFDVNIDVFRTHLALPPHDPRSPHPALVNAILLLGCFFTRYTRSPSLNRYEPQFLQAAWDELSQSFVNTDRLHDYVRASNLIAFYLLYKGCYSEAYSLASTGSSVAMSCNLHQITSSAWRPAAAGEDSEQYLTHPRDNVELGERIHTWWQTFVLDKLLSMVSGYPATLSNGLEPNPLVRITTPWPRSMSEYEVGHVFETENASVGHLYSNHSPQRYTRPETVAGLRAQAMSLMAQAYQISNYPTDLRVADNAIQRFMSTLPEIHATGDSGEIPGQPRSPPNPQLVLVHTLAHAASLILHQHGVDQLSRHRCPAAIQAIITILADLKDHDYLELFFGLGHIWHLCGEVLVKIRQSSQGSIPEAATRDLQHIMRGMKKLSFAYPVLGFPLHTLEQKLA